jgi:hypothetical protein
MIKLMECGGAELAIYCTLMVIKDCHPWVAAVTEVEMVHKGDAGVRTLNSVP